MSDTTVRHASFVSDLAQGISLKEKELRRTALFWRQSLSEALEQVLRCNLLHNPLLSIVIGPFGDKVILKSLWRIEAARREIPTPIKGSVIRHLNDPGSRFPLWRIEGTGMMKDVKKDVLKKIVGLSLIPEDLGADGTDNGRMSPEQ
jgi:hypothetical protein